LRRARNFIWNHWREKRRGYVVVRRTSADSASDIYMYIEPDDVGAWRVVWRWENLYCASCRTPYTSGAIYQSMEMVQKRVTKTDIDWPVGNEVERL
jgi:hypothetical protein